MLSDLLTIGDKIDILPPDVTALRESKAYVSQLMDIDDERTISIAMPYLNGLMYVLERDVRYRLIFYTSKGLYQCHGKLKGVYRENNAIMAQMQVLSELNKIQRRQYFRLECVHDIEYRLITQEEMIMEDRLTVDKLLTPDEKAEVRKRLAQFDSSWQKGSITDLSGGGARFNSDSPLLAGDRIKMKLEIATSSGLKKMILGAVIIASGRHENRNDKFEHRTAFYDIGKADREDLIKYIFEQERKRRRNEKV